MKRSTFEITPEKSLMHIYQYILGLYGPQGWWPLMDAKGISPTKSSSPDGYHPRDYSYPRTKQQQFEICVGAILTQNTSWVQAEMVLSHLNGQIKPEAILHMPQRNLAKKIKPAGFFNQKATKLKSFAKFYVESQGKTPKRDELLDVFGIGDETCDSMLLYAYKVPSFVVDTYTKKIFENLGLIKSSATYGAVKILFEENLKPDLITYQEYHALIVEHAKRYYGRGMDVKSCPLFQKFRYQKANCTKGHSIN